jgi:hypothetical protein
MHEHPLGFSCEDIDDRVADLERALGEAHRSLTRIHTWLGNALEQKRHRGDMVDAEGLIEDAYNEAAERVRV